MESAALSTEIPLEGGNNGYIKLDGVSDPALFSALIGFNYRETFSARPCSASRAAPFSGLRLFLSGGLGNNCGVMLLVGEVMIQIDESDDYHNRHHQQDHDETGSRCGSLRGP